MEMERSDVSKRKEWSILISFFPLQKFFLHLKTRRKEVDDPSLNVKRSFLLLELRFPRCDLISQTDPVPVTHSLLFPLPL